MRRSRARGWPAWALVLAACGASPAAGPTLAPVLVPAPAPASAVTQQSDCDVVLQVRVGAAPDGRRRVVVLAENVGPHPVTLALPDRCPAGPIALEGLAPAYDFYAACNQGACPPAQASPTVVGLGLGERREVAAAIVTPYGQTPCQPALAPGAYEIRASAPGANLRVCAGVTSLELGRADVQPPPPPTPPAPPPPRDPRNPYSCSAPGDCVLSCPEARGCCGWPCGCRHAIHRDHAAAFEADYPRTCARPPCPAVGCAHQPAFGATCLNGRCVGTDGLDMAR